LTSPKPFSGVRVSWGPVAGLEKAERIGERCSLGSARRLRLLPTSGRQRSVGRGPLTIEESRRAGSEFAVGFAPKRDRGFAVSSFVGPSLGPPRQGAASSLTIVATALRPWIVPVVGVVRWRPKRISSLSRPRSPDTGTAANGRRAAAPRGSSAYHARVAVVVAAGLAVTSACREATVDLAMLDRAQRGTVKEAVALPLLPSAARWACSDVVFGRDSPARRLRSVRKVHRVVDGLKDLGPHDRSEKGKRR